MAHHYIVEDLLSPEPGDVFTIAGDEAHHAVNVSRLRAGEQVSVSDGRGLLVQAQVRSADKHELALTCLSSAQVADRQPFTVLVQALAKGDRDERAIEAATELGVTSVIPWQASRSVSRWEGERAEKGRSRWAAIVREASKQSLRAWVPQVLPVHDARKIAALAESSTLLVLDPSGTESISETLLSHPSESIVVIVGPEGGLTAEEIETFTQAGACVVGLGKNILRTSTAGPAVLAVINELSERWR